MVQEIAIDTNILVRFLSGDDAEEFEQAVRLFSSNKVWISNTVLIETEWVLRKPLGHDRTECLHAFETLLMLENTHFENESVFSRSIKAYKIGMDFADAMHLYIANDHHLPLYTYDKALAKQANDLGANAQLTTT